jgi:serine/threonine-protein kinase
MDRDRPTLPTVEVAPDDVVVVPTLPPETHVSVVALLAPEGASPPPAAPRYVRDGELGRGGMGTVISVLDRDLNRRVAKKTAQAAHRVSRRFIGEAQVSAQLEHPNILPVYDLGVDEDGRLFFTMKRVEDHISLRRVIERLRQGDGETRRAYSFERRVQVVQQVAQALAYAHAHGVSHRDVKPENILVGPRGEVYLADWGVAGLRDAVSEAGLVGTVAYMTPERLTASAPEFDTEGDVYALVAVLYELLTLHHHVAEGPSDDRDLMHHRLSTNRHVDAKLRGGVPPALSHLCRRGLVDRTLRDAASLHDALQLWLEGRAPVVCPRTAIQRVLCAWSRFLDRHRIAGPALTFLVAVLCVAALAFSAAALL